MSASLAAVPDHRVYHPRGDVHADMPLHPEMPLIALLGLVHLRVARLLFVLGRGRRGDNRGIYNSTLAHQQTALGQRRDDLVEQRLGQLVALQPMAEVKHRRRVRHRVHRQIDAGKAAQGLAVVQRILQRLVRQPVPLLQEVDAQHQLQRDRLAAALALRVERAQTVNQPRPRHHLLHLGQELVAPRLLFLAGVFRLRKTTLSPHRPASRSPRPDEILPDATGQNRYFFSVSLARTCR